MQLSVIIVSYNALPFLELTLQSLRTALEEVDSEIILVDNNSKEPISDWISQYYPEVIFIGNKKNHGFGIANNIGLEKAQGELVLYLNPDTIITKNTVHNIILEFENDKDLGAVGLRMINGKGKFLPESKRSVPGFWSSLSRVIGLSAVFPKSRFFSYYRMGHIPEKSTNEIEVLSGACMFVRAENKQLIKFDPDYFMYGEDIDLSFRISQSGNKVKYFGRETIIHFKGESTDKKEWRYHYWFYKTMLIFMKKHKRKAYNTWNWLLIPFLSFLTLLSYLKALVKRDSKSEISKEVDGIFIHGACTEKLSSALKDVLVSIGLNDNPNAEIHVFISGQFKSEELIDFLEKKEKYQRVFFWNEQMNKLYRA